MKKRINLIVKGKGLISEMLQIKERKIRRALSSAIDIAEENKIKAQDNILTLANDLGKAETDKEMTDVVNRIFEEYDKIESYANRVNQVKELMALLEEEVEESEESEE